MTHSGILERWHGHRRHIETHVFKDRPPRVFQGEFLILAALEMIMATLDDVLAKVAEEKSIEQSLSVLLDGYNDALKALTDQVAELQAELAAAGQDTTKIDAIMASLDDNESVLNAARAKIIPAVMTPGPVEPPVEAPPAVPVEDPAPVTDPAPVEEPAPPADELQP